MQKNLIGFFSKLFLILLLLPPCLCFSQNNSKTEITLLSFNTWIGGTNVDDGQTKTLNAILMSGADIVGISEATDSIGNFLAERLGWYHYITTDNDIISRYPIKKTWDSKRGAGAEIELKNGKIIVLKAAHLNYTPYGPYRACLDTASVEDIIKEETTSGRMEEITSALNTITNYIKNDTPTFLMGDFNVPSHLDWTESTAAKHCGYSIVWPITKAVEDAGMIDSYRELHPDPATSPGITWSPVYKAYTHEDGEPEPMDRIDFIFYSGSNVKLLSSEIFMIGIPEQIPDHKQNEWPSDHAAVISLFSIETGKEITNLPESKFFADKPVISNGQSIRFMDISTNKPEKWSWFFEGGTPQTSTEQNPVVSYNEAGNFDVMLITTNDSGSDTTRVNKFIVVKP